LDDLVRRTNSPVYGGAGASPRYANLAVSSPAAPSYDDLLAWINQGWLVVIIPATKDGEPTATWLTLEPDSAAALAAAAPDPRIRAGLALGMIRQLRRIAPQFGDTPA